MTFPVLLALVLVVLQPRLARLVAARQEEPHVHGGVPLLLGVLINAVKNVLAALANLVSGLVFVFVADVAWLVVLLLATGSILGGLLGARVGRRLPVGWLRGVIVVVGLAALVQLLVP